MSEFSARYGIPPFAEQQQGNSAVSDGQKIGAPDAGLRELPAGEWLFKVCGDQVACSCWVNGSNTRHWVAAKTSDFFADLVRENDLKKTIALIVDRIAARRL